MNAVINLDKPSGITSQQAVTRVKRSLGVRKAGHTGTLDPMATGVLLVCLNEATKITRFLMNMDKQYRARVKLGERTDTYDAEGRILEKKDISWLKETKIKEAVKRFKGPLKQKPPMFSAVKVKGKPLYNLARKGIEIERQERLIEVYDMNIEKIDLPFVELVISSSKGTYIRTLCDDMGKHLGTGAHLVSLQRTRTGPFDIADAVSLDALDSGAKFFCSIDNALSMLQEIVLDEGEFRKAQKGMPLISSKIIGFTSNTYVKLKGPQGNLFAIGRVAGPSIRIERILNI